MTTTAFESLLVNDELRSDMIHRGYERIHHFHGVNARKKRLRFIKKLVWDVRISLLCQTENIVGWGRGYIGVIKYVKTGS